ncbi:hypothetical protein H0N96_02205 [Candidatus Micrarchaeota archaeon]|nr:hypothetical protein [Candidatus Micrarchaeota archaeon]
MKKLALELKQEINPKHAKIILVKSKYGDTRHIVFQPKGKYGEDTIKALEKRLRLNGIVVKSERITGEIWLSSQFTHYDELLKTLKLKERKITEKQLAQNIEQSKRVRKLYGELLKLKFKEKTF